MTTYPTYEQRMRLEACNLAVAHCREQGGGLIPTARNIFDFLMEGEEAEKDTAFDSPPMSPEMQALLADITKGAKEFNNWIEGFTRWTKDKTWSDWGKGKSDPAA